MNDNIDEMPCEKLPRNTTKIMYPDFCQKIRQSIEDSE